MSKCPHCNKPRKINSRKKLLKTCGSKECFAKEVAQRQAGTGRKSTFNRL